MELNYLHIYFLNENKSIAKDVLRKYIIEQKINVFDNKINKSRLIQNMETGDIKKYLISLFEEKTNLKLNESSYQEFIKGYLETQFSKDYNFIVKSLVKETNGNNSGIHVEPIKKLSFFQRLLNKKQPELKLKENTLYNLGLLNPIIKSKYSLPEDADGFLQFNAFIIFNSSDYMFIKEQIMSEEFFLFYEKIKNDLIKVNYKKLSPEQKKQINQKLFFELCNLLNRKLKIIF